MKSKHTRVNNKQTTQPAFMKILTFASLITLCIVFYSLPSAHGSELYSNDMISSQLGRDLLSVDTPSDAERKAAQKIIDRDAQLPRYIFFTNGGKLKSYPAKFCGGDNVDNCDTAHYAESILLTSAIGFIVAIVALLFGIVFWIFRCCCFGGCHASSGVCCPGDRYDEGMGSGYSNKHVLLVKLATVATLICLIPFFVVGHVGNADFTSAKNQFTGTILDAAQLVVSNLQEVNHTFSTLPAIPGIDLSQVDQALTTALTAGQDVIVQGKNIENTADHYNSIRQQVILAGLILPLVIIGATMIAGLFNLAPLALFGATVGFIVLSYGWIAFSIHYPLSLVSSDVCSTFAESGINGFVPIPGNTTYGLNNTTPNVIVNSLLKCGLEGDNSDNPFKPLLDIAQTGLTYAFDQVCNGFDQICDQTFPCGVDAITGDITYCHVMNCPADVTCNATTVSSYLKANITDFDLGCVVGNALVCPYSGPCANDRLAVCNPTPIIFEDCPDSCRLPQARNVTGVVVTGLNLLIKFEDILINNIIPLLDCSFISGVFGGVQDAICVTMVNSLVYISVGEAGLSIFMISGVILSILGIKRFNSANREGKEGSSHY